MIAPRLHYRFSGHALEVMEARNVSPEAVGAAIREPDVVEPHQGRRRFVKGDLVVVVGPDGVIVTVLLRDRAEWTAKDCRARWSAQ